MSWWMSKREGIINTSHFVLCFVEGKLPLLSEDVWIINVRSMSMKTATCRHHWAKVCFSTGILWQKQDYAAGNSAKKAYTLTSPYMNNQQSKYGYACTYVQSPSRFWGLKNHLTHISLRQNCTNMQQALRNQGESEDCNWISAAQTRTDFKQGTSHWNQVDQLFRTFWFHNSPEFTHISTKRM